MKGVMNNKERNRLISIYVIYRNYLYALREREEYGDRYGDTIELIEMYENKLKKYGIKSLRKVNHK